MYIKYIGIYKILTFITLLPSVPFWQPKKSEFDQSNNKCIITLNDVMSGTQLNTIIKVLFLIYVYYAIPKVIKYTVEYRPIVAQTLDSTICSGLIESNLTMIGRFLHLIKI